MENKLQITQDEINKIENFNLPLLQEAMRQTELKVADENARKERIDKRVCYLFTVCLGLISVIFGISNTDYLQKTTYLFVSLNLVGVLLFITATYLACALRSKPYSSLGTMPHTWLVKEYIQDYDVDRKNKNVLGYVFSYILYNYNTLLVVTHKSNDARIALLDKAILILSLSFAPIIWTFLSTIISLFV